MRREDACWEHNWTVQVFVQRQFRDTARVPPSVDARLPCAQRGAAARVGRPRNAVRQRRDHATGARRFLHIWVQFNLWFNYCEVGFRATECSCVGTCSRKLDSFSTKKRDTLWRKPRRNKKRSRRRRLKESTRRSNSAQRWEDETLRIHKKIVLFLWNLLHKLMFSLCRNSKSSRNRTSTWEICLNKMESTLRQVRDEYSAQLWTNLVFWHENLTKPGLQIIISR